MSQYYRKILRNVYLSLTLFFAVILYVVYSAFKSYAIEENAAKAQDLIMHNKALHTYVEKTLKPVFYDFQANGDVRADYSDPKVLSFTYISRHIMSEYNEQRVLNNLQKVTYKIASDNPRNLVNLASQEERVLLKKFNEENLTKFSKYITIGNHGYIYYAMPITKNQESCMRCHSSPENAPADLVKMYGNTNGFYEEIGAIRAFISIGMPLQNEIHKMQKLYFVIVIALLSIFLIGLLTIYFFIKKLDTKEQILQNQIKIDGLTRIYNRYKFNKDLEGIINSKRNETIYMMMFDIDHFKNINDTYGHPVGDTILEGLSHSVTNAIRPSDRFYRIGGEEFAIISFSHNNDETQHLFAQRIHNVISEQEYPDVGHISVSIGYTKLIKNESIHNFYSRCDKALYEAKNSGRNCIKAL